MKKITTIVIFLCAFRIDADAQQDLLNYELSSTTTSATSINSDLTASSINLSSGTIQYTSTPSFIYASHWSQTFTFSSSEKHWEFSFCPISGKQILINSMVLSAGRSTTGPANIQVQYSLDNFATAGIDVGAFNIANTTSLDQLTLVNLPNVGITKTITFKIWGYNASSTGNFRLNNIIVEGETTTLPISLTSFTAKAIDDNIQLNWKTASEENNDYFEIKRAANGKNFQAIGEIKGAGNSNAYKDYTFTDANPFADANYYQLVQHDFDGKTSASQVIAIHSKIAKTALSVYASPSDIAIGISSPNQTEGVFQIFDINGRKLATQSATIEKGMNNFNLPIQLENGIYLLKYTNEGEIISQKFLK